MKKRVGSYIALGVVFAASVAAAWLVPVADLLKGAIATPGIAALFGVLFQIARDQATFEKERFLQKEQQIFNLGAASHMAAVAFDKHVQYCEQYMIEVHDAVGTLFREGPTSRAMEHAGRLFEVNRQFAAWIPKTVALKLEPFENALRKLGAQAHLVNQLRADQAEARSKAIDESYSLFMNVMELGKLKETDPDHKKEIAIENVKEEVRAVLGINELTEIRSFIIRKSVEFVRNDT